MEREPLMTFEKFRVKLNEGKECKDCKKTPCECEDDDCKCGEKNCKCKEEKEEKE